MCLGEQWERAFYRILQGAAQYIHIGDNEVKKRYWRIAEWTNCIEKAIYDKVTGGINCVKQIERNAADIRAKITAIHWENSSKHTYSIIQTVQERLIDLGRK